MNDNKKILYNTGILYLKLILSTIIGLYCSRLVLKALGVDDYGLYSVVGGIVTFMNVIGTTMVSVSYRYIAVELGKGESGNPNKIYNTVYVIHLVIALCLIIIGETVGLFYVDNYLNVDSCKIPDAEFVLHASLITTAVSVMSVPSNGLIIAREKFIFTSLTEIGVALMKLILVIWLGYFLGNRLRAFALIMAAITITMRLAYMFYCRKKDADIIKWNFNKNIKDYKDIFSFAWWSLFGAMAVMGKEQGAALIINFFFGTALNAAFGFASQVNRYILTFSRSLNQAAVPQIMKSYGGGNQDRSLNLVYAITRITALIMMVFIIPLVFCMEDVLRLWLKEVPEYTSIFATWMLINGFVLALGSGFDPCIQSTGKIRNNEIGYGFINLLLLPIIWVLYKLGYPPYINVIVMVFLSFCTRIFQIFILKRLTDFEIKKYLTVSVLPTLWTVVIAVVPLVFLRVIWGHRVWQTLVFIILSMFWTIFSIWIVGVNKKEKMMVLSFVKKKINKISEQ